MKLALFLNDMNNQNIAELFSFTFYSLGQWDQ